MMVPLLMPMVKPKYPLGSQSAPVPGDHRPATVAEEVEAMLAVGGTHPGRTQPPER